MLTGCATAPQTLTVPLAAENVTPPPYGSKDYPRALAAIMAVMVRDLKLPGVEASVTLYPSQASYEAGVMFESERNRERIRQQLGNAASRLREEDLVLSAKRLAVNSTAVGMYRRVLINESRVGKLLWPDWIRLLTHELTHTSQVELIHGGLAVWDQWLVEGFAEWIGYQVADRFGAESFAMGRKRALERIATVKAFQTFPSLEQLANNSGWVTWVQTLGVSATYGQAFIAVDFLVEQKGLPAVIEYFRLFGKVYNRQRNFMTAFGESAKAFDERFSVLFAHELGA